MDSGLPGTFVLLPGLDGTGDAFAPFQRVLEGAGLTSVVVRYPCDAPSTLEALEAVVLEALPESGPYLVVAESFSGPLGLRVAARSPDGCVGLVIVASFHRFPQRIPSSLARIFAPLLFGVVPPRWAVRWVLTGPADDEVIEGVRKALRRNGPGVLASRLGLLTRVDATEALRAVRVPMLYLQAQHDRVVPAFNLDRMLAERPDIAVATLPTAHLVLQTAPGAALAAIQAWLAASVQNEDRGRLPLPPGQLGDAGRAVVDVVVSGKATEDHVCGGPLSARPRSGSHLSGAGRRRPGGRAERPRAAKRSHRRVVELSPRDRCSCSKAQE